MVHTNPFGKFQKLLAIGLINALFLLFLSFQLILLHFVFYSFSTCITLMPVRAKLKGIRKTGTQTVPKLEAFKMISAQSTFEHSKLP